MTSTDLAHSLDIGDSLALIVMVPFTVAVVAVVISCIAAQGYALYAAWKEQKG
jgi:hypothetical protein